MGGSGSRLPRDLLGEYQVRPGREGGSRAAGGPACLPTYLRGP